MLRAVIEILDYITISQLLLFCIIFFFKKNGNNLSNKLLTLLFLVNTIQLLTFYINYWHVDFFLKYTPHLVWSLDFIDFSIGPLLYLYICSLVNSNFKIRPSHALLFIPFAVFAYLCITKIVIQSPQTIRYIVANDIFLSRKGYLIFYSVLRSMNLIIAAVSIIKLLNYKKQIKSSDSTWQQFDLRWIFTVLLGFTVVFIFEGMKYVYYFKTDSYLQLTDTIHYVKFIVFSSLMFSGLKTSNLFDVAQNRTKYSKSPLMKNEKEILLERLKGLMNKEKYYLTPSITIQNVGEKLNEQPRYISQVINELLDQNYIDFVNSYRIEEAKKLLIDPKFQQYSILGIMLEVGFNSKSAFNNAFKKQTGHTPSEYKLLNVKDTLPE